MVAIPTTLTLYIYNLSLGYKFVTGCYYLKNTSLLHQSWSRQTADDSRYVPIFDCWIVLHPWEKKKKKKKKNHTHTHTHTPNDDELHDINSKMFQCPHEFVFVCTYTNFATMLVYTLLSLSLTYMPFSSVLNLWAVLFLRMTVRCSSYK